jgi:diguanylate cyclase (GGDEF)-like protein/PAS domain S-box-containing protein
MNITIYKNIFNNIKEPIMIIQNNIIIDANNILIKLFKLKNFDEVKNCDQLNSIINGINFNGPNNIYKSFELSINIIDIKKAIYFIKFNPINNLITTGKNIRSLYNKNIFNNSSEAIAILNTDKNILDINSSFENIFKYTYDEVIGKNIDDLIIPINKKNEIKNIYTNIDDTKKKFLITKRKNKYNDLIDVEITRYTIIDNDSIYGYYISYKDISKQTNTKLNLKEKETYFKQLFNRSLYPIAILDVNETIIDINKEFTNIFEYSRKEAINKHINELITPNKYSKRSLKVKKTMLSKHSITFKTKRKNKFGVLIDVEATGSPIIMNNKIIGMYAMYRNIRDEINALNELEKQQTYFKELFYKSSDAIALLNTDNKIINVNTKFKDFFEFSLEEIIGKDIDDFIVNDEYMLSAKHYSNSIIKEKKTIYVEGIRQNKSHKPLYVEITAYPITLHNNELGIYAIYRDISDRKQKEKEIRKLIFTDNLTGAYNRRKFQKIIKLEIARHNRYKYPLSLVVFDIDSFKNINDTFGHLIGDEILKEITSIVLNNIRENDCLFRWGGDEFAIILPHTDLTYANIFSRKLEKIIANTNFTQNILTSISCGASEYEKNVDTLIASADKDMYEVKKEKKYNKKKVKVN